MVRERVGGWRSAWRFALVGLLAGWFVAVLGVFGVLNAPFAAAQDQLFPAPTPDPRITLVALDSRSAARVGIVYPPDNLVNATVINYLASLHPEVILFDIPLDRLTFKDQETGVDTDAALATAIQNAGNVVLVCTADDVPKDLFASAAAAVGERSFANPDDANAVRGVVLQPAQTCSQNKSHESAFMQALRIAQGIKAPITTTGTIAHFGTHNIPLDGGQMLINFTKGTSPTCSYVDAFNSQCPNPQLITGHIVVVGNKVIDAGDVYSQAVSFAHDASFCPVHRPKCMLDSQNYGYRIMGDAISTVLSDRYLQPQPHDSMVLAALVLGSAIGLLVYVLSLRAAMAATGAILLLYYFGISVLAQYGHLSDPIYAPLAIVFGAGASLAARYVLVERERRKVERIFGHYVDPRIAQQLAASRSIDDVLRKGERRELTLLFVDVRGFTAMSEAMSAEDVQALVQDYLDEMSEHVLRWDGTIDKYVGDEIVAIWNAPVAQPTHALFAVRCAYDLIDRAGLLQDKLAERGLPPISWGVGINTGPAVVGNMGSRDRLQYTALGDTVNTAARFCGAAPAFTVLIGQTTFESCRDYIAVDELPGMQLKGKSAEKFRVFKVAAIREDPTSQWVTFPTDAAVAAYDAMKQRYAHPSVFTTPPAPAAQP
jgi:adenylate cyclase